MFTLESGSLPGNVTGFRLVNPGAMIYKVPENPKNEVSLWLTSALPRPTNLQIVSGDKGYVFDIIPTQSTHQDIVKVASSYGDQGLGSGAFDIIPMTHRKACEK